MRFVFIVLFCASTAFAGDNAIKSPVPANKDLTASRKLLDEVFGERINAARTSSAKSELADELLGIAESTSKPCERYAILEQVKKLAVASDDIILAFHVVDIMAETFNVDRLKLRTEILADLTAGKLEVASLRQLAELDMTAEDDPEKCLVAADGWYRLSGKLDGSLMRSAKERAATHYQVVLPNLTGLRKLQVQERIEESLENDAPTHTRPTLTPHRSRSRIFEIDCTKGLSTIDAQKLQREAAKAYGVPVEITDKIGMRLRFIPAGKFLMGSPKTETNREPDEKQVAITILKPFYIGMTEVTQEQYWQVTGKKPSHLKNKPNHPVEMMNYDDAIIFCEKLTRLDGKRKYKLPDEAQWEYACRAGTLGATYGPLDKIAWTKQNSRGTTHPVGLLAPNAWGLYDCIGNVWERCSEGYTPSSRVRGRAWLAEQARIADRNIDANRSCFNGFRVIMLVEP